MTNDDQFHHSDPLPKSVPDYGRVLHKRFLEQMREGFSSADQINAAASIIVGALRETYGLRDAMLARVDVICADIKTSADRFYDPVTNRRRSTIPFTQRLEVPHVKADDKMHNVRQPFNVQTLDNKRDAD
jgi:hypothetical protein